MEAQKADEGVVLRSFDPAQDTGFIVSTWPKAVYFGAIDEPSTPWSTWATAVHEKIKQLLGTCEVRIASEADKPLLIIGYSVVNDNRLEFVYVKKDYRGVGVGRLLCSGIGEYQPMNLTKAGLGFAKAMKMRAGR